MKPYPTHPLDMHEPRCFLEYLDHVPGDRFALGIIVRPQHQLSALQ